MRACDNPFRSACIDGLLYRAPDFSWSVVEDRLAAHGGRGAIVGPEGHGKTTLLLGLLGRRKDAGGRAVFLKMEAGQRRLSDSQREQAAACDWIFLDSSEQLGWTGWRELIRLTKPAHGLVVTSHRPCRLPTVFTCHTSPALLAELLRELRAETPDAAEMWARHRGNIREALRELYDRFAVLPG